MPWPTEDVAIDSSLGLAFCRLAMGMDGLYRRTRAGSAETALSAEGQVPVDLWRGEPLSLADWPAARGTVAALQAHTSSLADPVRRAFVEDMLVSLATIVDWQAGDDGLTFRERAARLLGLLIEPIPSAQLSAWRSIVEPVRSAEELHIVPLDQIEQIFRAHLEEAHRRAQETVGDLPPRPLMYLELARDFLIEDGLAQPSWATTRVRFMQDALRAPFVFAYYLGFRSVFDASAAWRGTRTEFYQSLYGRLHSPASLRLSADLSERSA